FNPSPYPLSSLPLHDALPILLPTIGYPRPPPASTRDRGDGHRCTMVVTLTRRRRTHGRRPTSPHRRGVRPHRDDPLRGGQAARSGRLGAREEPHLPRRPLRAIGRGGAVGAAVPGGVRRRGPAVRGVPPGARGAGRALGGGGRGHERAR